MTHPYPVQTGCFRSSILLRYEYDRAKKLLVVVTKRSDAYRYENVTASVVQKLQDAPSAGQFWNTYLKKKYLETRVGTSQKPHSPLGGGDLSAMPPAAKRSRTAFGPGTATGTLPVISTSV